MQGWKGTQCRDGKARLSVGVHRSARGGVRTSLGCTLKCKGYPLMQYTALIAKRIMKEFNWRRGRNNRVCVEDGGRGVRSSDAHPSLSQPLKCISLTPHEDSKYVKLWVTSYVGVRLTLRLEYKTAL